GQRVVSLLTEACGSCQRCRAGREHRCLEGQGIGHGRDGGFAQRVKLRAAALVPLPTELEPAQACLLACPIGVVVKGVGELARPRPGERALVTGAGGGLGVHALQLARAAGATVLALTSSPSKAERLQALGAHEVVLMGELDFSEVVLALTEDRGAEVIVDTVGSPLYPSLVRCLAQDGRLLSLGEVAGEGAQVNLAEFIFRDATLVATSGADRRHVLGAMAQVREGLLRPVVAQTMPLERAAEAYRLVRQRAVLGRIVLVPPT
ncbi:MAG: alcohol dehydrogenase catalytic domain-containing protein, partial [Dehalococcoidia bacterium]